MPARREGRRREWLVAAGGLVVVLAIVASPLRMALERRLSHLVAAGTAEPASGRGGEGVSTAGDAEAIDAVR